MVKSPHSLTLLSPEATTAFALKLAPLLHNGDVILLQGGIGAGKTHFARSLIQHLMLEPEDVPSPTFTLVQVYDGAEGEIWHSDLYRLSDPDEAVELGLEEAFENAICLVEWPDRLSDLTPENALMMEFSVAEEGVRDLTLNWSDRKWDTRMAALLGQAGT